MLELGNVIEYQELIAYYESIDACRDIREETDAMFGLDLLCFKSFELDLRHLYVWVNATASGKNYYKFIYKEGNF